MDIFSYWKSEPFSSHRGRIYSSYLKEVEHIKRTRGPMSDSSRRRMAIANLTEDLLKVLNDLRGVLKSV